MSPGSLGSQGVAPVDGILSLAFGRRLLDSTPSFPNFLLDQPPSLILFSIPKVAQSHRLLSLLLTQGPGGPPGGETPLPPPPLGVCKTRGFQVRFWAGEMERKAGED